MKIGQELTGSPPRDAIPGPASRSGAGGNGNWRRRRGWQAAGARACSAAVMVPLGSLEMVPWPVLVAWCARLLRPRRDGDDSDETKGATPTPRGDGGGGTLLGVWERRAAVAD